MNDYYADLGVARDATAEDIKRAYRKLARQLPPRRQPRPRGRGAVQEGLPGLRRAVRPGQAAGLRPRRRTPTARAPPASARASPSATSWTPSSAARPAPRGRGPRSRTTRGQDALVRLDIDLGDAVFGAQKDLTIDTAVACSTCRGAGMQPGTSTRTCDVCAGRGEVQQVQRRFLGQVMTTRPCIDLPGLRPAHHRPVLRVLRRRPGAHPPHAHAQGAGRRRHGHPHPARR